MSPVKLSNQQLANTFYLIGNLLEIKGEVIYKILAYRKVGDNLMTLNREAYDLWQQGQLSEIPGVGKAIAEKIDELFTTGQLGFLEKLSAEVPPSLAELLQVPDLGPKKIALFWKELGITDLAALEAAARAGKLRDLPGMGEKSEVMKHSVDIAAEMVKHAQPLNYDPTVRTLVESFADESGYGPAPAGMSNEERLAYFNKAAKGLETEDIKLAGIFSNGSNTVAQINTLVPSIRSISAPPTRRLRRCFPMPG